MTSVAAIHGARTAPMATVTATMRVFSTEDRRFADVRNSNVLLYWPHGFGDWVQLSTVLPLLEPTNRYWITRFGDDNVSVLDGDGVAVPAYLGVETTDYGERHGNLHFGLRYAELDGTSRTVELPRSLYRLCAREGISDVLWTAFPETAGHVPFPYHTKARNALRLLVGDERAGSLPLAAPLRSSLRRDVGGWVRRWVESRLENVLERSRHKLCIVGRNGYTSVGKNWGNRWREDLPADRRREGEECRDFMRELRRKDSSWIFIVMEDRLFDGDDTVRDPQLRAASYAELFGASTEVGIPYGIVARALMSVADLVVGVPAGPYHLSMLYPEVPTVGIWIQHLPSWYDEPKVASIHVVSRNVRDEQLDRRPGSFSEHGGLLYRTHVLDSRIIPGASVVDAVEELL